MTPPTLPLDIPEPPKKDDNQEDPPPEMEPTFQPLTLTHINGLFMEATGGAKQFVSGFNENDFFERASIPYLLQNCVEMGAFNEETNEC